MIKKEGGGGMGCLLAIGVVVLWFYPEARVVTANFLRSSADLLEPQGRVEQRNNNPKNFTIRNPFYQEGGKK